MSRRFIAERKLSKLWAHEAVQGNFESAATAAFPTHRFFYKKSSPAKKIYIYFYKQLLLVLLLFDL